MVDLVILGGVLLVWFVFYFMNYRIEAFSNAAFMTAQ